MVAPSRAASDTTDLNDPRAEVCTDSSTPGSIRHDAVHQKPRPCEQGDRVAIAGHPAREEPRSVYIQDSSGRRMDSATTCRQAAAPSPISDAMTTRHLTGHRHPEGFTPNKKAGAVTLRPHNASPENADQFG